MLLRLAYLMVALGLVAAAVLNVRLNREIAAGTALANEIARLQATRVSAQRALVRLTDFESGQRGLLLTGDEAYFAVARDAERGLDAALAELRATIPAGTQQAERAEQMQRSARLKAEELNATLELYRAGRRDEAQEVIRTNQGLGAMTEFRRAHDALIGQDEARLAANYAERDGRRRTIRLTSLGGVTASLVLAGLGGLGVAYQYAVAARERHKLTLTVGELDALVAERTRKLELANVEVQRFAYIVSHDLRAPLVSIGGFSKELRAGVADLRQRLAPQIAGASADERAALDASAADLDECINYIDGGVGRMGRLIDAVLRLSRAGRREGRPEKLDVAKLVQGVADSLAATATDKDARVEVDARLPACTADRVDVEQTFGNLIDNALKYLDPARPGVVRVNGRRDGKDVVYEVTDNGRGMTDKEVARAFELFGRVGPRDQVGEGVGLTLVREVVAARLHGNVGCRSAKGEGTTFTLRWPAEPPAAPDVPAPTA